MIQDIEPYVMNNQYNPQLQATDGDYVVAFSGGEVLIKQTGSELVFPTVAILAELIRPDELIYLFSISDERYFLCTKKLDEGDIPGDFALTDMRAIRERKLEPKHRNFAVYTAKHLADWYRDNRFCGRCGKPMMHSSTERAVKCTDMACGYTAYPRIMPAVIVGVTNGDKLLLTRYRRGYQHNALIAGFTEIGETVEETVAREVMEESGLRVKNIRYYKSQPWGSANDILLGFYCDVDGDTTIKMDSDELKYADWVKKEDIVLQPDEYSLTNEMMKMFKYS